MREHGLLRPTTRNPPAGYPPNGLALTAGSANVVSGVVGGVCWVLVTPIVISELVTSVEVGYCRSMAVTRAPAVSAAPLAISASNLSLVLWAVTSCFVTLMLHR
jgi:hypothetical protein